MHHGEVRASREEHALGTHLYSGYTVNQDPGCILLLSINFSLLVCVPVYYLAADMERADVAHQQPAPYKFHLSTDQSEKSYSLDEEELRFFKTATGIEDATGLQNHIIGVQREAYKVSRHSCTYGKIGYSFGY